MQASPELLYLRGAIEPPARLRLAVVGARFGTALGRRVAYRLGRDLAAAGLEVVSGLARGVDTAVLEGALAEGGRVGAVLGNGLASIYPAENVGLAESIVESGGFILSELPLDAEPLTFHFPKRNRLISALAHAVVVVEAGRKSGSLVTAGWALDQGREVFVFPGPVDTPHYAGSHELLRDGARLVTGVADLLVDLGLGALVSAAAGPEKAKPRRKRAGDA